MDIVTINKEYKHAEVSNCSAAGCTWNGHGNCIDGEVNIPESESPVKFSCRHTYRSDDYGYPTGLVRLGVKNLSKERREQIKQAIHTTWDKAVADANDRNEWAESLGTDPVLIQASILRGYKYGDDIPF